MHHEQRVIAREIVSILKARQGAPNRAAAPPGPEKLGLVIQGGGMRGVYSLGAAKALEPFSAAFDHVFGSSSGAINAAYFAAQQCDSAAAGYCFDLARRAFIAPLRFWRIIDIDYLIDHVVKGSQLLDLARVARAPATVHITMTDAERGEEKVVTNREMTAVCLFEVLRATAALPIVYGKSVMVLGRPYIDGGLVDAIPFFRAVEAGCTHVIVILTSHLSRRRMGLKAIPRIVLNELCRNMGSAAIDRLAMPDAHFNATMETLASGYGRYKGTQFIVVSPALDPNLASRLTKSSDRLMFTARTGYDDLCRALAFDSPHDDWPPTPRP
jgi:predicted patatin/cPLA2 family phospholipase